MTRSKQVHKWLVYTLALIVIWMIDAFVLPRFPLWGMSPMLLVGAVVAVAIFEGAQGGAGFGLAVGLWWELAYPSGDGSKVFLMSCLGMAAGSVAQYVLSASLACYLLCSAGALMVLDALRVAGRLIEKLAPLSTLLETAVAEVLLSLLWCIPIYFLFRAVFRRVGGERLAR